MHQSAVGGQTAFGRVSTLSLRRRIVVLLYPLAFAVGSAYWLVAAAEPEYLLVSGIAAICVAVRLCAGVAGVQTVAVVMLCVMAGVLAAAVRGQVVAAPRLTEATPITGLWGRVTAIEPGRTAVRLVIVPYGIEHLPIGELPRRVRLTHRSALAVRPGDDVRCRVRLYPPAQPSIPGEYDFGRHAWFSGIGAVGYAVGACGIAARSTAGGFLAQVSAWRDSVRRDVAEYVHEHTGRAGGIAAAMISGDRSFLLRSDIEALRVSGLGHLLAISGLHMGLVIGVVFFAVRRLWPVIEPLAQYVPAPKVAAVVALAAATGYLILSGGSVSTQRAWVMGAVALGAVLADRSALSLVSVANSMWIVMLLRPEAVLTPGFQMSFGATAGLIALYENWPRRRRTAVARVGMWAVSLLACSVVTCAATAPFALYHFGRAAPLSVIANMLAMPVVSFVTAPSAVAAGFAGVVGLAHWPLSLTGASLALVLDIASGVAVHDPGTRLARMPSMALVLFTVSLVASVLGVRWWRCIAVVPLIAGICVWAIWSQPVVLVSDSGNIYVRSAEQGWQLWRLDGRREQGLRPLTVRGEVIRVYCSSAGCQHRTPAGSVVADADGVIRFRPDTSDIRLSVAEAQNRGGAVVLSGVSGHRVRFRLGSRGQLRPWQSAGSGAG